MCCGVIISNYSLVVTLTNRDCCLLNYFALQFLCELPKWIVCSKSNHLPFKWKITGHMLIIGQEGVSYMLYYPTIKTCVMASSYINFPSSTQNRTFFLTFIVYFRHIFLKKLQSRWKNCFLILLKVILLLFARGLMRFGFTTTGVDLYTILIPLISGVTITTAVSSVYHSVSCINCPFITHELLHTFGLSYMDSSEFWLYKVLVSPDTRPVDTK